MMVKIDMTATEYLTLAPEERKRLAAKRSRERSRARRRGDEVPPTIEEELGLKRKKEPKPKKQEQKPEDRVYHDHDGNEISYEQWKEQVLHPVVFAPRGPVPTGFQL